MNTRPMVARSIRVGLNPPLTPASDAAAANSTAHGRITGRNRRAIQKCSGQIRIL